MNRTYATYKHLYISLFLLTIFGPIYHGPPGPIIRIHTKTKFTYSSVFIKSVFSPDHCCSPVKGQEERKKRTEHGSDARRKIIRENGARHNHHVGIENELFEPQSHFRDKLLTFYISNLSPKQDCGPEIDPFRAKTAVSPG